MTYFPSFGDKYLRDYSMDLIIGKVYEVWLERAWELPQNALLVKINETRIINEKEVTRLTVLIDQGTREIDDDQLFLIGTSKRPNEIIVRRVKPILFETSMINIQPMTMPYGLLFALDFKYANSKQPRLLGLSEGFKKTHAARRCYLRPPMGHRTSFRRSTWIRPNKPFVSNTFGAISQ